jgi:hypothetical protein
VHPGLDRVHRPEPHRLQRLMIQLAAVVLAHTALLQNQKIKSVNLRSSWYHSPSGSPPFVQLTEPAPRRGDRGLQTGVAHSTATSTRWRRGVAATRGGASPCRRCWLGGPRCCPECGYESADPVPGRAWAVPRQEGRAESTAAPRVAAASVSSNILVYRRDGCSEEVWHVVDAAAGAGGGKLFMIRSPAAAFAVRGLSQRRRGTP